MRLIACLLVLFLVGCDNRTVTVANPSTLCINNVLYYQYGHGLALAIDSKTLKPITCNI